MGGFDWNWAEARNEYETALKINPNYLAARQYYAINLATQGNFDGMFENARKCLEIDPLLPVINANLAWFYYLARQYENAEEQARLTIEIEPNHFSAHWVLGITYGQQKRFEESIKTLQNAADASGNRPFVVADLARILADAKQKAEARKILKRLGEAAKENYICPLNHAKIHLGLGENDKVFEWLEKGFAERAVRMPTLLIDPQFDALRGDQRFRALLEKTGVKDNFTA